MRQFQQTPYKIDPIQKASDYLLDRGRLLPDDELYQRSLMIEHCTVLYCTVLYCTRSLMIEPRSSRLSVSYPASSASPN